MNRKPINMTTLATWLAQHGYPRACVVLALAQPAVPVHLDDTHVAAVANDKIMVCRAEEKLWTVLDEFRHGNNPGEVDRILNILITYKTYRRARGGCIDMTDPVCRGQLCFRHRHCVDHR